MKMLKQQKDVLVFTAAKKIANGKLKDKSKATLIRRSVRQKKESECFE